MREGGSIIMVDLDPMTMLVTDERPVSDEMWVWTMREAEEGIAISC